MFTIALIALVPGAPSPQQTFLPTQETRQRLAATFDPDGVHDDAGYFKDPHGLLLEAPPEPGREHWPSGPGADASSLAAPSNDNCANAAIVPGNTITYNPGLLSTTTATTEACGANETCVFSSFYSVFFSYTPDQDGAVFIDTFGSNYDTVLSVWNACGFFGGVFCSFPTELACNNDFGFGTASQIYMEVDAGTTYVIKAAANSGASPGNLDFNLRYVPRNDNCLDALDVNGMAFDPPLLATHNAATDVCEPNESCESGGAGVSNSVWYRYVPPCDGTLSLNTNGSSYDTVLSVWDGCSTVVGGTTCIYPAELACDDDSGTGLASQIVGLPVTAGEEYLVKVADYNTSQGGGYLDFNLVFDGASPPTADITSPADFDEACNSLSIQGTADAAGDAYADWVLEYRASAGPSWTQITSSTSPLTAGTLAFWNTSALPTGHYQLRLTVSNACGLTATDFAMVYVDHVFSSLDLRAPAAGQIVGGVVCLDGTAWDAYFSDYRLEYASSSGYQPIDPATPSYATPITNDPLHPGGWDTRTAGIPDGDYVVRLRGTDLCGNSAEDTTGITIDNTPPIASIDDPRPCEGVARVVEIEGTASDVNLRSWVLEYTGGAKQTWVTIAQGSTSVIDGVLGVWNTTGMKTGGYTLRLTVFDESIIDCDDLQRSQIMTTVNVGKTRVLVQR